MSLQVRLQNLITAIGTDYKVLVGRIGDPSTLTTTAKSSTVAAINEVKASIGSAGATINDTTPSGTSVYSSSKTNAAISSAVAGLVNGAGAALDTLQELATALGNDANFATTVSTALGLRLRVDTAAQGLTTTQQANGQTNLNVYDKTVIGDPETDLVALYTTAKA